MALVARPARRRKLSKSITTAMAELRWAQDRILANNAYLRPEFSVGLNYDLASSRHTATVTLPNNSFYTVEGAALDKVSLELGASVSYLAGNNIDVSLGLNSEFRKDYKSFTGMLRFRYDF